MTSSPHTTVTEQEIATQPEMWRRAAEIAPDHGLLAHPGRMAFVGCGTSYNAGRVLAALREQAGWGEADAFEASEVPPGRQYDCVIAISRSGTTSELLTSLDRFAAGATRYGVLGVVDSPIAAAVDHVISLAFADEASIVQTRFPTTVIALGRAEVGHDVGRMAAEAEQVLMGPLPIDPMIFDHLVFLGRGWTNGIAAEAALKVQEVAGIDSEAHVAMEYRHGPITRAGRSSAVWVLGDEVPGLRQEIAHTGATVVAAAADPLIDLINAQRVAVALAGAHGRDPDHPQWLSRSVVLDGQA